MGNRMTQTEAISKIEDWLLVPVGIENVMPALVALKGSYEYYDYLQRVAEAEYRTAADLEREVDEFAQKHPAEQRKSENPFAPKNNPGSEHAHASDLAAFQKFASKRVASSRTDMVRTCSVCGGALEHRIKEGLSPLGIKLLIITLLFCLPLVIVPLLMCREEKDEYYCPRCRKRYS